MEPVRYDVERMTSELFFNFDDASDSVAIHFGDVSLSRRELLERTAEYAAAFEERGAKRGDQIAVWTHPSIDTVVALVACARFGYVTVPINPNTGSKELEHILSDAAPSLVISNGRMSPKNRPQNVVERAVDDAPLLLLYTSGTTGAPKGAVLTARNCASNLDALADAWEWTSRDEVVHALPLFHVHGLVLGLYGSLRRGCALRWYAKFDPLAVARDLCEHSMLFAVPTMIHRLAEAAESDPEIVAGLSRARLLISGSAGLPVREHERISKLTGRRIIERYGLTETLINCSVRVDDPPQPGRVGKPLRDVEVKLVDDARNEIDAHDDETIGEIAVRGANIFDGYLNRADATAAAMDENHWFFTGDLATRDSTGSLRIVGRRATDLIKIGGFKVGAGEIEAALLEHAGVKECAVIGEPDEDLGERIVAFVVARESTRTPDPKELIDHVAKLLATHKRPREVVYLNELPRNAMGKVVKGALKR